MTMRLKPSGVCLYLILTASQWIVFGAQISSSDDAPATSLDERNEDTYTSSKEIPVAYQELIKLKDLLLLIGIDASKLLKFLSYNDSVEICREGEKMKEAAEDMSKNQNSSAEIVSKWLDREMEEELHLLIPSPDIYSVSYDELTVTSMLNETEKLTTTSTVNVALSIDNETYSVVTELTEPFTSVTVTVTELPLLATQSSTELFPVVGESSTEQPSSPVKLSTGVSTELSSETYPTESPFPTIEALTETYSFFAETLNETSTESYSVATVPLTEFLTPSVETTGNETLAWNIIKRIITYRLSEVPTDFYVSNFETPTTAIPVSNVSEYLTPTVETTTPEMPMKPRVFEPFSIERAVKNMTPNISEAFTEFSTPVIILLNFTEFQGNISSQTVTSEALNATEPFTTIGYLNTTLFSTERETLQEYLISEAVFLNDTELYFTDKEFSTVAVQPRIFVSDVSEQFETSTPIPTFPSSTESYFLTEFSTDETTVLNVSEVRESLTPDTSLYNVTQYYFLPTEPVSLKYETISKEGFREMDTTPVSVFPSNLSSTEVFEKETTPLEASTPFMLTTLETTSNITTPCSVPHEEIESIDQLNEKLKGIQTNMSKISEELKSCSISQKVYEEAEQTSAVLMELFHDMQNILKNVNGRVQKNQRFIRSKFAEFDLRRRKRQEINKQVDNCIKEEDEPFMDFQELVSMTKKASEHPNDLDHLKRTKCCSLLMKRKMEKGDPLLGQQRERITHFVDEVLTFHLPRLKQKLKEEEEMTHKGIKNLRNKLSDLLKRKNYILHMTSVRSRQ